MKEKIITKSKSHYTCDKCDYNSTWRRDVEDHEKTHLQVDCLHADWAVWIGASGEDAPKLTGRCPDCSVEVCIDLPGDNHPLLRQLFLALDGEQKLKDAAASNVAARGVTPYNGIDYLEELGIPKKLR